MRLHLFGKNESVEPIISGCGPDRHAREIVCTVGCVSSGSDSPWIPFLVWTSHLICLMTSDVDVDDRGSESVRPSEYKSDKDETADCAGTFLRSAGPRDAPGSWSPANPPAAAARSGRPEDEWSWEFPCRVLGGTSVSPAPEWGSVLGLVVVLCVGPSELEAAPDCDTARSAKPGPGAEDMALKSNSCMKKCSFSPTMRSLHRPAGGNHNCLVA